ncbi:MAG: B12-binding domain-containing radical SAM protein [Planctomycetes bacterium RBG_16_41_13]|nr:MAG: B12-binding domain-containing radical SAM protein [Planctomycetes bacterium RBG_16_41_13]
MKVLLINPPYLKKFSRPQRSPAVTKSGTLYFPLWLAYATGVLEEKGFEVDLVDAPADNLSIDDIIEKTRTFQPNLIVLDTSTPSIDNDVAVARRLKETCPSSFILLVGTHVSALPEEVLNKENSVDAVARNEYDYTLPDLAKIVSEKGDLKTVHGISYRDGNKIIHNPGRPYIENLDELPFVSKVYKKFLRIENYFNPNALYPMVTITTSRGCPFPCTFCVYPQTLMGRGFRQRSINNVVEEMEYITKNFPQAKAIFFEDDTLTVNKKRCKELAECILQKKVAISWTANARVGLDYETMRTMKTAGCRSLCVGFESGSQQILDTMKKKLSLSEMEAFMANAKKAGMLIHGCFMAGLPGETKETLKETLNLAKRLNPDTVQFYPVMVYPGTEAYTWYKEKRLITTDNFSEWLTPEGLHNTVISTEELSSYDLVKFCDDARRSFYLRPGYLFYKLKQMIVHPREIKRTLKSARTFFKYLLRGSDVKPKIQC